MKTRFFMLLLLAGCTMFAGPRVFFGVGVGYAPAPVVTYAPPPPPVYYAAPPVPGPGYSWVAGYYYPVGPRWAWHAGYWARPPYARAYWVGPRYSRGRYFGGYWRR
jgi:WXXGXW repeat (2 copies)